MKGLNFKILFRVYIDFKILFRGEKLPGANFCLVKKITIFLKHTGVVGFSVLKC